MKGRDFLSGQVRCQDKYEEPIVFTYPNATVRVYKPILTDEERAKRMKEIEKAVIALMTPERKKAK